MYELLGVAGLKLGYLGSVGYLERNSDSHHLAPDQNYWNLAELQGYVQQEYDVVFDSKQSYYSLFEEAGISWKKHRNVIPKKTQNWSKKRQEITDWLEAHRAQIVSGQLVVFVDECHLLWGDLCGYVWGKTERIEVPINQRKPTMEPLISALSNV